MTVGEWSINEVEKLLSFSSSGSIDEDVVVIEASSTPQVTANEEINVTSTDSEVEIVTVGENYRWDLLNRDLLNKVLLVSGFVTVKAHKVEIKALCQ